MLVDTVKVIIIFQTETHNATVLALVYLGRTIGLLVKRGVWGLHVLAIAWLASCHITHQLQPFCIVSFAGLQRPDDFLYRVCYYLAPAR